MTMDDKPGDQTGPAAKSSFSFGFSKKLKPNKVQKEGSTSWKKDKESHPDDEEQVDLIKEVNAKGVQTTKAPEIKKAAIIPCPGNKYKLKPDKKEVSAEERLAAQELIEDSKRWLEKGDEEGEEEGGKTTGTIPLNQEEKEKQALDSDLKDNAAESSTMDDYDDTPVNGFGMAMLRGMGFDPKVGVGGFNKAVVECTTPDVRPKGLGLGAQRPNTGNNSKAGSGGGQTDEDLTLKKGCHVIVEGGKQKGCYGKVEGLDEEAARVIVKLSVGGGEAVSLSEALVRVVTKEEYKKFSKVINKDAYEKYAKKQQEREIEWDGQREAAIHQDKAGNSNEGKEYSEKSSSQKRKHRSRSKSPAHVSKKKAAETWVRPQLRVRLIDEDFKGGKYYNSKVVVEDVVSPCSCVVRTDTGRVVDGVDPRDCETVIPKQDNAVIMIVKGKRKGQLGEVLGRDKHKSRAAVQLLPDKDELLKLEYDDICEFVGDVEMYS